MNRTPIDILKDSVCQFIDLGNNFPAENSVAFNGTVHRMHEFRYIIDACYSSNCNKDQIMEILTPALDIYRKSPFVRRLQDWPRGYPGDYETIEYILTQQNKAQNKTIQYYIEEYAIGSMIAQQHRNKVYEQAKIILNTLSHRPSANILSFAAGGAPDFRECLNEIRSSYCKIVLNDMDEQALAFSSNHLSDSCANLASVNGNALTSINKISKYGAFDLILCGGLFDYLTDKQIIFLLKNIFEHLLNIGGIIFFTNIAERNPFKTMIEHFGDWKLIERTEDELRKILSSIPLDKMRTYIYKDGTNLAYLIEIHNLA